MITVVIADRKGKGQNVAKGVKQQAHEQSLFQEWAQICV